MSATVTRQDYKWIQVAGVPEGWEMKTISDVASVTAGGTPSRNEPAYWNGNIPWITTSKIDFNVITSAEQFITEDGLENCAAKLLLPGTLLMALYGQGKTRGKVAILGIKAATNQACAAIIPNPGVSREYLFHYLASHYEAIRNLSNTGNQENLNGQIVRSIPVMLPPLPEQRAIAAALSDADALINSLDRIIAKKRDLKQAAIQELLTGRRRLPKFRGEWEPKSFDELFEFQNTANNPRAECSPFGDIGYIHYGDIHTTTSPFLNCADIDLPLISQRRVANIPPVQDGDLVMVDASEDYAGIGKWVEIRNTAGRKIVAGLHTLLLRGRNDMLADGFKAYMQLIPSVRASLIRLATGISVYGVTKNNVKSIEVLVPPIVEQAAIATVLQDLDAEIATLEQRRDKTRALRQGMMQELLTGKTRLV